MASDQQDKYMEDTFGVSKSDQDKPTSDSEIVDSANEGVRTQSKKRKTRSASPSQESKRSKRPASASVSPTEEAEEISPFGNSNEMTTDSITPIRAESEKTIADRRSDAPVSTRSTSTVSTHTACRSSQEELGVVRLQNHAQSEVDAPPSDHVRTERPTQCQAAVLKSLDLAAQRGIALKFLSEDFNHRFARVLEFLIDLFRSQTVDNYFAVTVERFIERLEILTKSEASRKVWAEDNVVVLFVNTVYGSIFQQTRISEHAQRYAESSHGSVEESRPLMARVKALESDLERTEAERDIARHNVIEVRTNVTKDGQLRLGQALSDVTTMQKQLDKERAKHRTFQERVKAAFDVKLAKQKQQHEEAQKKKDEAVAEYKVRKNEYEHQFKTESSRHRKDRQAFEKEIAELKSTLESTIASKDQQIKDQVEYKTNKIQSRCDEEVKELSEECEEKIANELYEARNDLTHLYALQTVTNRNMEKLTTNCDNYRTTVRSMQDTLDRASRGHEAGLNTLKASFAIQKEQLEHRIQQLMQQMSENCQTYNENEASLKSGIIDLRNQCSQLASENEALRAEEQLTKAWEDNTAGPGTDVSTVHRSNIAGRADEDIDSETGVAGDRGESSQSDMSTETSAGAIQ